MRKVDRRSPPLFLLLPSLRFLFDLFSPPLPVFAPSPSFEKTAAVQLAHRHPTLAVQPIPSITAHYGLLLVWMLQRQTRSSVWVNNFEEKKTRFYSLRLLFQLAKWHSKTVSLQRDGFK